MARLTPISEIISKASSLETDQEKINFLRGFSQNKAITILFQFAYDKDLEILLPDSEPPYKKTKKQDAESIFYLDAELLKRVITPSGFYPQIKQLKREEIFIRTLEDMDQDDSAVLASVVYRKGFDGISFDVVNEVFGFGKSEQA